MFRKKIITREDNTPYLIRYTIFTCKLFSIKIHKILISDDACLHDHPWSFISIILKGGYVEERIIKWNHFPFDSSYKIKKCILDHDNNRWGLKHKRLYGPGSILFRKAKTTHRLQIYQTAWTLVITFKKIKSWGFFTKNGWVEWFKYKQQNQCD